MPVPTCPLCRSTMVPHHIRHWTRPTLLMLFGFMVGLLADAILAWLFIAGPLMIAASLDAWHSRPGFQCTVCGRREAA